MASVYAEVGRTKFLQLILNQTLTLKLYSNNVVPASGDTAASFTEVAGGGYASKSLTFANWTIALAIATYLARDFNFTGATDAPGTVYGYFIVDSAGVLYQAERFGSVLSPVNGSLIRVTPKMQAA